MARAKGRSKSGDVRCVRERFEANYREVTELEVICDHCHQKVLMGSSPKDTCTHSWDVYGCACYEAATVQEWYEHIAKVKNAKEGARKKKRVKPIDAPVTPAPLVDPLTSEANEVNTMHQELLAMGMDMIARMIALGEKLDAIKGRLGHGSWEDWVKANLTFTSRTARRYMEAYRHRDDPLIKDDPVLFLEQIRGKATSNSVPEQPDNDQVLDFEGDTAKSDTSVRFEPIADSLNSECADPQPEDADEQRHASIEKLKKLNAEFQQLTGQKGRGKPKQHPAEDPPAWSDSELARKAEIEAGHSVLASVRVDKKTKLPIDNALIAWAESQGLTERIDRTSDWGNPYEIDKDGTREEVIEWFREYFAHKRSLHERLDELKGKVLICWCHPEACHGQVLIDWLSKEVTDTARRGEQ